MEVEMGMEAPGQCERGTTYQTNNETIANVAEGVFSGCGIVFGEARLEISHAGETRDLTWLPNNEFPCFHIDSCHM
jgi:hypothetical protein